jgi:cyclohexa-1,5-dienecarbonyl-CoA hydratase
MSNFQFIDYHRTGPRADLTLRRPPRNVLNVEMLEEMVSALEPLHDDDTIKVLVIRGSGANFCGGAELSDLTSDRVGLFMPSYTRIFNIINNIRGVVLAGIQGEAYGAGCELACFSDITIAAKSAKFCFPDLKVGLFPPIASAVLPRLVGRNRAFDWIFSGRVVNAEEALINDLISRMVPDGELDAFIDEYAGRIASLSAAAVQCAKRALDGALYIPVMDALKKTESTYMLDLMNSIDPHEGIRAALEGRAPVWRNR